MDLLKALSAISNISLEDTLLFHAVLPIRWGSLSLQRLGIMASSGLLASSSAVRGLVLSVLPSGHNRQFEQTFDNALFHCQGLRGGDAPLTYSQRYLQREVLAEVLSYSQRYLQRSALSSTVDCIAEGCWCEWKGKNNWLVAHLLWLMVQYFPVSKLIGLRLGNEEIHLAW